MGEQCGVVHWSFANDKKLFNSVIPVFPNEQKVRNNLPMNRLERRKNVGLVVLGFTLQLHNGMLAVTPHGLGTDPDSHPP